MTDITKFPIPTRKVDLQKIIDVETRVEDLETIGAAGAAFTSGGPVATASTANVTLSGEQTIDGVITSTSRVLVKDQTAPEDNGIYVTAAGAWARATDMDAAGEVAATAVYVSGGTTQGGMSFATYSVVTTLGTDAITFVQVSNNSGVQDQIEAFLTPEKSISDQKSLSQGDSNFRSAAYFGADGAYSIDRAKIRKLNGRTPESVTLGQDMYAGNFLDCLIYMNNSGQSLGEQHLGGGNHTLTQEYESRAFQFQDSVVANIKPLISSDSTLLRTASTVDRYGENPMYGMCGFLWELVGKENGITPSGAAMRLITANNAKSATPIGSLDKGSTEYNSAIAQATALAAGTPSTGDRLRIFGTGWYQGESDTDTLNYDESLNQLAIDYAADFRAANTVQDFDPLLVTYQPTSDGAGSNRYSVNRLIFKACVDAEDGVQYLSKDVPLAFSTPNYFMDFRYDTANGIHINARDAKWLGGYTALVFKRIFVDGGTWPMMRPIKMEIENGAIFVKFQMRAANTRLVVAEGDSANPDWDGHTIPQQTGRGFHCVDGTGADIALASLPEVVAPDTIKIVPTGSTGDVARIDYGQRAAVKMHPFAGSAGNFRDNYGDLVFYDAVNRPMHNWMPIHSIAPAANAVGFTLA